MEKPETDSINTENTKAIKTLSGWKTCIVSATSGHSGCVSETR